MGEIYGRMNRWPAFAKSQGGVGTADNARTEEDAAFLQRLQEGDDAAWEKFFDYWGARLFSYFKYSLRSADEAEDAVGETMVAVVQAIRTFDGNVTLATFIYSIAYRKVADYWRRLRVTSELTEWISTEAPNHTRLEVHEALAELSEQAQQALLLRYYVGLSVSEIADVLGRSYKATESLLSRVRRQFETAFYNNGAEAPQHVR
jgi:RNA polymerase sigma-70 factor (ECF subfamily)